MDIKFIEDFAKKSEKYVKENQDKLVPKNYFLFRIYRNRNNNIIFIGDIILEKDKKFKDFNYKNLGACTKNKYHQFIQKYIEIRREYFNKLKKMFKIHPDYKIHISIDDVNIKKFKAVKGTYFSSKYAINPNGLWYACNIDFYQLIESGAKKSDKTRDYINLKWNPINIYNLYLDKLNIYKITNCKQLKEFSMKYKNNSLRRYEFLDLNKLKKDFDGLELCPYNSLECAKMDKYMKRINLNKVINLLLDKNFTEEEKSVIWSLSWEASSGVVWKNFRKIDYTKIDL